MLESLAALSSIRAPPMSCGSHRSGFRKRDGYSGLESLDAIRGRIFMGAAMTTSVKPRTSGCKRNFGLARSADPPDHQTPGSW